MHGKVGFIFISKGMPFHQNNSSVSTKKMKFSVDQTETSM
jgi:hypothetical protein